MKEAWKEYYTEQELKEIQRIELESLDVLSDVCRELGIVFFLYGGSMLGAVKYGGFVPWDDDLDIALTREDYEKLLNEGPALLPEGYELQEPRINKRTPFPYMKFRRTNTTMVEYVYRKIKINHGVYFDIYPIDNLPDDDLELQRNQKRILRLSITLQRQQTASLFLPAKGWRAALRKLIALSRHIAAKAIPRSLVIKKMNAIMTGYNCTPTNRQGNYFFPRPVNYYDGVLPPVEVIFEGRKMLLPSGYKVNLQNRYGDITKDLPEKDRIGHRPYLLDLNLEAR